MYTQRLASYAKICLLYEVFVISLVEIGDAVKTRRKAMKLTQSALAERAGVSLARVEGLENGRLPEMGFKNLSRILAALGLDLRLTDQNQRRPTLEDLRAEEDEE